LLDHYIGAFVETNYDSTTNISRDLNIEASELFFVLNFNGWIIRKDDKWMLTKLGETKGGKCINNEKFGEYIGWPKNQCIEEIRILVADYRSKLLTATAIANKYQTSPQRINLILSEIGWIEQVISGWQITKLGKIAGGVQKEHSESGKSFVVWPQNIHENKAFIESLIQNNLIQEKVPDMKVDSFRTKFPANMRAQDGHFVRSKAELLIDNQLYQYGLVHAYERKLPIEEELYCDFYLPSKKVYIEYWGLENDTKYLERKKRKLEIYKREEVSLIEIHDADISNLDDMLPKHLLQFGIKVY
jgi:hypothetical protein